MKKLIITADDYGMSPAVNEAIDAGIEEGIITATNVMTNMDYCQDAVRLKEKKVSVGLHWTLSCGRPVLSQKEIPSLTEADGNFYPYQEFRKRFRGGKISEDEIRKELMAQYEKYEDLLGQPDYWNTHQNVHVDFKIYRLFVDLAVRLKINKMRSHQRIYVKASGNDSRQPIIWQMAEPIKSRMLNQWQKNAHKKGVASPEGLIVCLNNSDAHRMDYLFQNISWKSRSVGELVIHPATSCDSAYFGQIASQRIKEYKLYSCEDTLNKIHNSGLELVNYDSVCLHRKK